ncbi:MAG TPA: hypothetical protein VLG25_00680 [Patescibacteria group bacterium]|nr:hypothetical protein [Patescibacteria group bacterium]
MAKLGISVKRLQINKATANIVLIISAASFVTIFSLFASKALLSQRSYQSRVIKEKTKARNSLSDNLKASEQLVESYKQFVAQDPNILASKVDGTGDNEGDNAKIVLDALPSKYDFPALATSLEKILKKYNYADPNISGTDDTLNQQAQTAGPVPVAVAMPFQIEVNSSYEAAANLFGILERSIRPIQVNTLSFTASDSGTIHVTIAASTYYQPEKNLKIDFKDVK